MRNFRGELSQVEYAEKIDKQKTVIGRLESPAYSGWSLRTMLDIAQKEDVAVLARFVDFPTFLSFTDDMSDDALHPQLYNETKTKEIASYLTGAKTYFELGPSYGIAGGNAMETLAPAPYGNIFFGVTQTGMTLAPTSEIFGLSNVTSGVASRSISQGSSLLFGQNMFAALKPPLPSSIARTEAAIRWLIDLATSQKAQIDALQFEITSLRQASPTQTQSATRQSFPSHTRRQMFGNPLDALEAA
jgi:hypothetical protein